MKKVSEFIKSDNGKKLLFGLSMVVLLGVFYVFHIKDKTESKESKTKPSEFNVTSNDTVFKTKKRHVYYQNNKEGKTIDSDTEFFTDVKSSDYENILKEIDTTQIHESNEDDMQRIADSIRLANNNKLYSPSSTKKSRYNGVKPKKRSHVSNSKINSKTNVQDIDKEYDAFFSNKKNSRVKQTPTSNESYDIKAVINGEQKISNGDRLELRLLETFVYNGITFDKNTIFFGVVSFSKKRINVSIFSINNYEINFRVYDDFDGMLGIYTQEENLLGETKNTGSNELINEEQELEKVPLGQTIKRVLTRRKSKEDIKVTLLNNTLIRLKN